MKRARAENGEMCSPKLGRPLARIDNVTWVNQPTYLGLDDGEAWLDWSPLMLCFAPSIQTSAGAAFLSSLWSGQSTSQGAVT